MKKNGFTLAEVLITLLIVGVVATLTTPALVKNVGSSKIGPQLSKFVNTWETGIETMMMEKNVNKISSLDTTITDKFFRKLSKYIIMSSLKTVTSPSKISIISPNGTELKTFSFNTDRVWQLKDGTIIIYDNASSLPNGYYSGNNGAYTYSIASVYVDLGGIKGSHRVGKEVFAFLIDNTGVLVPYGSNAHKAMGKNIAESCNPSSNSLAPLLACTGAVADNGWKAPW